MWDLIVLSAEMDMNQVCVICEMNSSKSLTDLGFTVLGTEISLWLANAEQNTPITSFNLRLVCTADKRGEKVQY